MDRNAIMIPATTSGPSPGRLLFNFGFKSTSDKLNFQVVEWSKIAEVSALSFERR